LLADDITRGLDMIEGVNASVSVVDINKTADTASISLILAA
jgi:hypothetical protein